MKHKTKNIGKLCMPKNLEMVQCENQDYPDMFMIVNYDEKKDTYNISYRQKTIFEIKSKNLNIKK